MSANLVVDLGNTTDYPLSVVSLSGQSTSVGQIVDLLHANTYTNVWVSAVGGSGELPVFIQTSDATTSGTFTDPTSGLPAGAFPVSERVVSGGIFWVNSGLWTSGSRSPTATINNAPLFHSGGVQLAAFQRPHRYARLVVTSGNASIAAHVILAGFVAQKKTTGASGGGGFTFSPGSGVVSV